MSHAVPHFPPAVAGGSPSTWLGLPGEVANDVTLGALSLTDRTEERGLMTAPSTPRHSPWLVLTTLCLGFFMILLDTTIVNIAIPSLSDGLHASLSDILWILNAYVLVYAVLLITAGRLGDLYGPKQLFIVGLVIFTGASVACGFAQSPGQLIVFRILQGVGGALLTPQTLSVLTVIFPAEKRGAAFGIWGAVAGIATVAGPTLGGWLVTDYGWRWIFFVNLPVGIVTLVLAAVVMPNLRLNRRHRLDWVGTVLATAGLFLVTYGLIEGQSHDWGAVWGPVTIPEVIAGGVVILGVFLWHQYLQRDREPLVPFSIFRNRNFSVMNWVVASIAFGMLGLFLPLTIFLQSVLGLTALQAGLAVAPMSLISMVIAPFAGRFADRVGGKWILFAGLTLFSTGMAILIASSHVDTTRMQLLPGLIVAGFGLGMTFAPLQTIAMRDIEPRMAGAASGLINTTRQLGGVIGSAAVGALLQAQLSSKLTAAAVANAGSLPAQVRGPAVDAFTRATSGNLDVGAGQTGVPVPQNLPAQLKQTLVDFATTVFHEGYTNAMRTTLILPIAVLGLAALTVLLVRRLPSASPAPVVEEAAEVGAPAVGH
ncbi:MAG TPA: DHA2 family efflux MFS transporter permease subunit [Micromonosporaceae bacterium]